MANENSNVEFAASQNISIFPLSANRPATCSVLDDGGNETSVDIPGSRFLDEINLRNIVKSVTDRSSFVIHYDDSNDLIEFVIDGYYVCLKNPKSLYGANNDLFAYVTLNDNNYIHGSDVLNTNSNAYEFQGIRFVTSEGDIPNALQLFANGSVPETSRLKFNASSVKVTKIIGGNADSFK